MKFGLFISGLLMCFTLTKCSSSKPSVDSFDTLQASALYPYGRFLINNNQQIELISSAVHFGFTFKGTVCQIYAKLNDENGHNYLQYELDGVYQKRLKVEGKNNQPINITTSNEGTHTLWIYKATEAHSGAILIEKITGKGLTPLKTKEMPLIEFIGNSITCGAAADASEVPCGTGIYHDQHNAYFAYGPRVARALDLNFMLSSVSGIGIYRNWNSDGPTMPNVYEKADFQDFSKQLWKFENEKPQIVSIALGTNDFSDGDGKKERKPFDSTTFIDKYVQFVKLVKSKYPTGQIVLLSSPMIGGEKRTILQNCLVAVKKQIEIQFPNDKSVELYFFKPMKVKGCSGHPSVEDHAILAEELIPFFKKLL